MSQLGVTGLVVLAVTVRNHLPLSPLSFPAISLEIRHTCAGGGIRKVYTFMHWEYCPTLQLQAQKDAPLLSPMVIIYMWQYHPPVWGIEAEVAEERPPFRVPVYGGKATQSPF